jgi:archaellum component FlaC
MAVMERERWTDERIDERFNRVDADIGGLRTEMRKGFEQIDRRFEQIDRRFEQIDKRFDQIDKRFERVDDKFDAMQRNMTTWFNALFLTILASLITGVFAVASFT